MECGKHSGRSRVTRRTKAKIREFAAWLALQRMALIWPMRAAIKWRIAFMEFNFLDVVVWLFPM